MIPQLKPFVPSRAGWLIFGPLSAQVVVALFAISDWVAISVLFVVVSGLLSETHFGATYLFFVSKQNRRWFFGKSSRILLLSIGVGVTLMFGWISVNLALLAAAMFSGFHVTRQAVGVRKLIDKNSDGYKCDLLIYVSSTVCLLIAGYRFGVVPAVSEMLARLPLVPEVSTNDGHYLVIALLVAVIVIYLASRYASTGIGFAAVVHGALTYLPYLLFANQLAAHLVAVSGHWLQYLTIQSAANFNLRPRPSLDLSDSVTSVRGIVRLKKLIVVLGIVAYATVMTAIWSSSLTESGHYEENTILLIPIVLHVVHYVIDGQIWKFSDPYIRRTIGLNLQSSIFVP